jgi:hypothetical protein
MKAAAVTLPPDYMQLKLIIGAYCALLWSLFGKKCDYCKELLKIHRILDHEECFTIQDATKEICARMTWAIIDNGRSFFRQNPVALDFAPGHHCQFSVSCLKSIIDTVRNALPIQCATFPKQSMTALVLVQAPTARKAPFPNQVTTVPPPAGWHSATPTPPREQAQGKQGLQKRAAREDIRHQKISLLMDPYLAWYNNYIDLLAILTASGKRTGDLPSMPQYCTPTRTPLICWNSVLGRCF